MILPNKNIILTNSLLGLGLIVLNYLNAKETTSSLWSKVRGEKINTFEKFVLVLDFLYTVKLISIDDGLIHKNND
jgi:hypothetical protein